jgi:acyl-CoA thioester hydrolase
MAKPDPALLEPSRYPFRCEIETRYRDLDSNLHINNGVFASLLEEGRVRFHRASEFGSLSTDPELTSMVVSVAIEYLGQSHFPAPLEMHVGAARIGQSSYDLCQLVMQEGDTVAFAKVTLVCVKDSQPFVIPASHRELAKPWMLRP